MCLNRIVRWAQVNLCLWGVLCGNTLRLLAKRRFAASCACHLPQLLCVCVRVHACVCACMRAWIRCMRLCVCVCTNYSVLDCYGNNYLNSKNHYSFQHYLFSMAFQNHTIFVLHCFVISFLLLLSSQVIIRTTPSKVVTMNVMLWTEGCAPIAIISSVTIPTSCLV